ncbi:MAG: serine/threonine protein kinase [Phycisphaerales bacterium]
MERGTGPNQRADDPVAETANVASGPLYRPFHDQATDAQSPTSPKRAQAPVPSRARPNAIGPYRLLRELGEGGFGVVYLAEQDEPIRRRVALKVIKPGMHSPGIIARFEHERRALASMEHPNIARVFDAGTTEDALPYFVMEFVDGEPITSFCDRRRLGLRERLQLFIPVCHAIQHAHQKGLIHRDIKPSNVLVFESDGAPIPKVIDFGVAKALAHTLSAQTQFTEFGNLVGTPEYMSPEQASGGETDVDTRSDIYSLGVLLYELLTGALPFDSRRLRQMGYAELMRVIREEEPPTPARRLSTCADPSTLADNRRASIRELSDQLRGELGLVPTTALHKDRDRRYRTALELADDLSAYLKGMPLRAAPDTAWYRAAKFVGRNRFGVGACAVFFGGVALSPLADAAFYADFGGPASIAAAAACLSVFTVVFAGFLVALSNTRERRPIPWVAVALGAPVMALIGTAFTGYTCSRLSGLELDWSLDETLAQLTHWWYLLIPGVALTALIARAVLRCTIRRVAVGVLILQAVLWAGSLLAALAADASYRSDVEARRLQSQQTGAPPAAEPQR